MSDASWDRVEDFIENTWKPTATGVDRIRGTVTAVEAHNTQYSNMPRLCVKMDAREVVMDGEEQPTGAWTIWERAQLRRYVMSKHIRVGDELDIFYDKLGGKNGNMKVFKYFLNRSPESEPWVNPFAAIPTPPKKENVIPDYAGVS